MNSKWAGGRVDRVSGPHYKALRVKDLNPGESGYMMPWAYDDGGINEDYPIYSESTGTATLRVTRNSHGGYDICFTKTYVE